MMITELAHAGNITVASSKCSAISGPCGSHHAYEVLMDTIILLSHKNDIPYGSAAVFHTHRTRCFYFAHQFRCQCP